MEVTLRLRGGTRFILGTVLNTSGTGVKSINMNINHASAASTLVDCERCQRCNVAFDTCTFITQTFSYDVYNIYIPRLLNCIFTSNYSLSETL